ncbi:MAG: SDR family oxidoreductase [Fibrobacterales bacterium]
MNILIVGATGATGKLLTQQLLSEGHSVTVVVRSGHGLPDAVRDHPQLTKITGTVLDFDEATTQKLVRGVDAIASCLGHNISIKGMWGAPRRLVRDTLIKLCTAVEIANPEKPVKVVLMNSTGCQNRDLKEKRICPELAVIGVIRFLVPPHADNEQAGDYLRTTIGQKNSAIEWVAVRPDGLIDSDSITDLEIHPMPTRSPIFNAGKTSRINVAHFMKSLITDGELWNKWQGQMPVIYNNQPTTIT